MDIRSMVLLMILNQQQLFDQWGVWLSYSSGTKKQEGINYGKNLKKFIVLRTWGDFAFFCKDSILNNIKNFFPDRTGQYTKFEIESVFRKIDSINFFKGDVEPTWEYGDNDKGGYFNFAVVKDIDDETAVRVYRNLITALVGNSLQFCKYVKGIRFVDTVTKFNLRYRVQIWTTYRNTEQDKYQLMMEHTKQLTTFLNEECKLTEGRALKFYNIDREENKKNNDRKEKDYKN